jgi:hypothetical protein
MREFIWRIVAWIVARPAVTRWLIQRAQRTPYYHIAAQGSEEVYMGRWWLFNPYGKGVDGEVLPARWSWLPSIRIHHILRADNDRDLHDHPWNARTIILSGWYEEERPFSGRDDGAAFFRGYADDETGRWWQRDVFRREIGYTGRLLFGQYHRISAVPRDGVWTLFLTWRKRGAWGFLVNGQKMPWREYLNDNQGA